jgi:hypothetical protein
MLPNRDPERESRCLLLPRVALSNLGPPSCDSLHHPGLQVLLPLPMRASSSKQAPRDLKPTVEAWRLIATRDAMELTPAGRACQAGPAGNANASNGQGTGAPKFGWPCNSKRPPLVASLRDWFDSHESHHTQNLKELRDLPAAREGRVEQRPRSIFSLRGIITITVAEFQT